MEIISYVVDGELTHGDSLGHERTLTRGQVQYMSAGSGIVHSEHNHGTDTARFLQIWILPDRRGRTPAYGDHRFAWADRVGRWLLLAGPEGSGAPAELHQDARISAAFITAGSDLKLELAADRQAYLVLIEGDLTWPGNTDGPMGARDALEITGVTLPLASETGAHVLVVEMARE